MDPLLRELPDHREITALLNRYGTSLDDRDWERLRRVFTEAAVGDYNPKAPSFEGRAAIEKLCRDALEISLQRAERIASRPAPSAQEPSFSTAAIVCSSVPSRPAARG